MKYRIDYWWQDNNKMMNLKVFYLPNFNEAVRLSNMIADSDLRDDKVICNLFFLFELQDGQYEEWEGINGETFEEVLDFGYMYDNWEEET